MELSNRVWRRMEMRLPERGCRENSGEGVDQMRSWIQIEWIVSIVRMKKAGSDRTLEAVNIARDYIKPHIIVGLIVFELFPSKRRSLSRAEPDVAYLWIQWLQFKMVNPRGCRDEK